MVMMIHELAAAAGVNVQTIRYYERRGILEEPPRTAAGYRQYAAATVERVRFIKRAQALGFTLSEIEELLGLRVEDPEACTAVEARAREKLAAVEAKIEELRRLRLVLQGLVRSCGNREPTAECPILEALEEGEPR